MDQQYYNDWDFVDPPQKEFYCPLCEQILNEPKLTECCGKHFCTNCIDLQKPCPNPECNQEHFFAILDKPTWNKIKELDVLCPLKGRGCHWKGEMSMRVKHLDQNNETGCEYIDVACTNGCGEEMERYELPEHLKQFCGRRPYTCEHCGIENVFEFITKHHIPECPAHPITCQNNCGFDDITRSSYSEHLLKCPEQEIDCEFLYVGCEVKVKRKDSAQHQREGVYVHLSSQTAFATQQLSERDNKIEELSIAWENKHQHVLQTVETCREEQEKNSKQLKLELAQKANDIARLNEQLETKDKAIEDLHQCLKDLEVKLTKALKDISTELNQALQNQSAGVQNTKLKADQLSVQFVRNKRAIEESIKQRAKEIEAKLLESRERSQHKLMEGISAKVAKDIKHTMKKEIEAVSTTTDELKKKIEELDEKYRAAQMFQKPKKSSAIDKSSPVISSTDKKAKKKPLEIRRSL